MYNKNEWNINYWLCTRYYRQLNTSQNPAIIITQMFYVYYMYYISEPCVLHLCYISDLCITYINLALDTATASYSDNVSDLVIGPLFRKVYVQLQDWIQLFGGRGVTDWLTFLHWLRIKISRTTIITYKYTIIYLTILNTLLKYNSFCNLK